MRRDLWNDFPPVSYWISWEKQYKGLVLAAWKVVWKDQGVNWEASGQPIISRFALWISDFLWFSFKIYRQVLFYHLQISVSRISKAHIQQPTLPIHTSTMHIPHSNLITKLLLPLFLFANTLASAIPHNITSLSSATNTQSEPLILLPRQANIPSLTNDAEFRRTMLSGHNFYRFQHGAGPVVWNDQRAITSAQHSRTCIWRHSGVKGVGENSMSSLRAWT